MNLDLKKILLYLGLAFGVSWAVAIAFYMAGGKYSGPAAMIAAAAFMCGPFIAVVVTQKLIGRDSWKNTLRFNFRLNPWWIAAWLLPPALAFAAMGAALLFPGIGFSPDFGGLIERYREVLPPDAFALAQKQMAGLPVHPFWITLLSGLGAGATLNFIFGYGEEIGWRGLLFEELRPLGFWRRSLAVGAVWGVWHAPLVLMGHNYPGRPAAGAAMMIAWCVLLSPIFSLIRLKTASVPAAALLHGTLNGTAGLGLMLLSGGDELTVGLTGLAGFIVLAVVDAVIFVYLKLKPRAAAEKEAHG